MYLQNHRCLLKISNKMLIEFILAHVFNDIKVDNVVAGNTILRGDIECILKSGYVKVGNK